MTQENIVDFNKEKITSNHEPAEVIIRRESWKKMIKENGLEGFFKNDKSPPSTGIVLDYDVEELKKHINPLTNDSTR